MNRDDVEIWRRDEVTVKFFEALKKEHEAMIEAMVCCSNDNQNVLLLMGRILGRIQLLGELCETDLSEFILSD